MTKAFFNDGYYPEDQIFLHGSDLSIHRGYGVFDFFKLRGGQNPWIEWYLERFFNSAKMADLPMPVSATDIKQIVDRLIEYNHQPDSYIKMILTGGYSENGFTPSGKPNLIIFNMPYRPPAENDYRDGVKLLSIPHQRALPRVKSTNYFQSIVMSKRMKKENATDILYYYPESIFETSRCNIFIVKNQNIITPAEGILEGITRRRILEMPDKPLPLEQRCISRNELDRASEVFITSTTKGILPVVKIDEHIIGDGKVGPVTKALSSRIRSF